MIRYFFLLFLIITALPVSSQIDKNLLPGNWEIVEVTYEGLKIDFTDPSKTVHSYLEKARLTGDTLWLTEGVNISSSSTDADSILGVKRFKKDYPHFCTPILLKITDNSFMQVKGSDSLLVWPGKENTPVYFKWKNSNTIKAKAKKKKFLINLATLTKNEMVVKILVETPCVFILHKLEE